MEVMNLIVLKANVRLNKKSAKMDNVLMKIFGVMEQKIVMMVLMRKIVLHQLNCQHKLVTPIQNILVLKVRHDASNYKICVERIWIQMTARNLSVKRKYVCFFPI